MRNINDEEVKAPEPNVDQPEIEDEEEDLEVEDDIDDFDDVCVDCGHFYDQCYCDDDDKEDDEE